jgi:hypothetical protein
VKYLGRSAFENNPLTSVVLESTNWWYSSNDNATSGTYFKNKGYDLSDPSVVANLLGPYQGTYTKQFWYCN